MSCLCKRVLLVDDEPEILEALAEILESEGVIVAIAHGVDEALDRLAAGFHPSAVITDLMMPMRSGEELVDDLRHRPGGERLPIVAISASAQMLSRVDERADASLQKPFTISALFDTLDPLCASPRPWTGGSGPAQWTAPPP